MITYFLRYSETRVLILTIIMLALIIQTNIVVLLTIRNNFRRNLIVEYGKFVGILFISILILLKFVEIFLQYTKSNYIVDSNIFFVTSTIIVLIILIRGPIELYKIINEGDSFLSNMSIREVIDNLDTGILIYTKEGSIILINEKMKKLLKLYYGDVKRDGKEIWKDLNNFCDSQALTCIKLQNSQIFRLEDISYEFSIDEITVDDEVYSQVLAFDVTERDKKIQILENKNNELSRLVSEYEIMKKNIQEIVEESVKLHLKMNLHDTLGHYLSMIQAVTASERYTEISLEKLNLFDVLDIYKLDSEQLPEAKLIDMKTFFEKIGICIQIDGIIPENDEIAECFVEIIREATTNAIIHSGAIKIDIIFEEEELNYKLAVSNDGLLPTDEFKEGGGMKGMRYKTSKLGGFLFVELEDKFTVKAAVPKIISK